MRIKQANIWLITKEIIYTGAEAKQEVTGSRTGNSSKRKNSVSHRNNSRQVVWV